jgi:hypothetical protein
MVNLSVFNQSPCLLWCINHTENVFHHVYCVFTGRITKITMEETRDVTATYGVPKPPWFFWLAWAISTLKDFMFLIHVDNNVQVLPWYMPLNFRNWIKLSWGVYWHHGLDQPVKLVLYHFTLSRLNWIKLYPYPEFEPIPNCFAWFWSRHDLLFPLSQANSTKPPTEPDPGLTQARPSSHDRRCFSLSRTITRPHPVDVDHIHRPGSQLYGLIPWSFL